MATERILVVDDEEDLLELIDYNLAKEGYRVTASATGEAAIEEARESLPDLIVLDLLLPSVDGLDVCKPLKADPKTQHIPIVMLTAKSEEADVVTGLELGADDYITKPFSPRVLLARIRTVLRRKATAAGRRRRARSDSRAGDPSRPARSADRRQAVELTFTEFRLLHFLARKPGWAFSRSADRRRREGRRLPGDRAVGRRAGRRAAEEARRAGQLHRDGPRRRLPVQGIGDAQRRLLWQLYPSYLRRSRWRRWWASAGSRPTRSKHSTSSSVRDELQARGRVRRRASIGAELAEPTATAALAAMCAALGEATGSAHRRASRRRASRSATAETPSPTTRTSTADRPEVRQRWRAKSATRPAIARRSTSGAAVASPCRSARRRADRRGARHSRRSRDVDRSAGRRSDWRIVGRRAWRSRAARGCARAGACSRQISRPLDEMRQRRRAFARGELGYKLRRARRPKSWPAWPKRSTRWPSSCKSGSAPSSGRTTSNRRCWPAWSKACWPSTTDERVISLNKAAGQLLGIDPAQAQGRSLQEVVRNADLRRFVTRVAQARRADRRRRRAARRSRAACCKPAAPRCTTPRGRAIGAVVVLNDVTEFRRLEHIRRDFVANVSHELKTPITSIKGFVETLLDGAMQNPDDAERFLQIVAKQADRLNAIIEDLLSLSKIEQGEEAADIVLEPGADQRRARRRRARLPGQGRRAQHPGADRTATTTCSAQHQRPAARSRRSSTCSTTPSSTASRAAKCRCSAAQADERSDDHASSTAAAASRPSICRGSSSGSIASTKPAAASSAAPAWAWRSSSTSCRPTDGRVTVKSTPGAGSTFTIHLPRPRKARSRRSFAYF